MFSSTTVGEREGSFAKDREIISKNGMEVETPVLVPIFPGF
jgi:hypothetical protein